MEAGNPAESRKTSPLAYMRQVYKEGAAGKKPSLTFQTTEWEPLAKAAMSNDAFGYVYGSAGKRETSDKNLAAFRKWSILPSRLISAPYPDLRVKLFGEEYPFPIAMAPVGVQTIVHGDGELASAAAAVAEQVPYIMSSASSTSIEDVAKANGMGRRWFQLYWPGNDYKNITLSMLERAKAAGFTVLVVTIDTFTLGHRPDDLDNGYNPFLRPDRNGVEIGLSDPVFQSYFRGKHGKEVHEDLLAASHEWISILFPGPSHSWEDLKFLQDHWQGPIVLKGIQTAGDTLSAIQYGVQGIIVSNHGGRQQDGGPGSLNVLPAITAAVKVVKERVADASVDLEILFDSGVRSGADIAKALALGAKMVLVGRPWVYGMALDGQAGVRHVLKALIGELCLTLHLSGIRSVDKEHLNRNRLLKDGEEL